MSRRPFRPDAGRGGPPHAARDDELMAAIEEIEDRWDREWLVETDKAWDAIHRCLTGGILDYGPTPLHKCILGEAPPRRRRLHREPAGARMRSRRWRRRSGTSTSPSMRRSYFAIDPDDYDLPLREEDFGYTWDNFQELRRSSRRRPAMTGRWSSPSISRAAIGDRAQGSRGTGHVHDRRLASDHPRPANPGSCSRTGRASSWSIREKTSIAQATALMREWGPVHAGSPAGDFNVIELPDDLGWAVTAATTTTS